MAEDNSSRTGKKVTITFVDNVSRVKAGIKTGENIDSVWFPTNKQMPGAIALKSDFPFLHCLILDMYRAPKAIWVVEKGRPEPEIIVIEKKGYSIPLLAEAELKII